VNPVTLKRVDSYGALPVLKLVSQPPLQLLADASSFAILPITEPGAYDGVRAAVVEGARRDPVVLVLCTGL